MDLSNVSTTLRRIIGIFIGLADFVLLIIVSVLIWQGKIEENLKVLLKFSIPIGIVNFLLIWIAVGENEQNYWKGFLTATGLLIMVIFGSGLISRLFR